MLVVSEGKGALIDVKGRTITGFASSSIGGELVSVLITLDDGSVLDLEAKGWGDWPDAVLRAKHGRFE